MKFKKELFEEFKETRKWDKFMKWAIGIGFFSFVVLFVTIMIMVIVEPYFPQL